MLFRVSPHGHSHCCPCLLRKGAKKRRKRRREVWVWGGGPKKPEKAKGLPTSHGPVPTALASGAAWHAPRTPPLVEGTERKRALRNPSWRE